MLSRSAPVKGASKDNTTVRAALENQGLPTHEGRRPQQPYHATHCSTKQKRMRNARDVALLNRCMQETAESPNVNTFQSPQARKGVDAGKNCTCKKHSQQDRGNHEYSLHRQ